MQCDHVNRLRLRQTQVDLPKARAGRKVYCDSKRTMRQNGYPQIFLNVAFFLLMEFRPVVIGGFFKLITSLVLAYLLAFVLVNRTKIFKVLVSSLQAPRISGFPLLVARRRIGRYQTTITVPDAPSLSPLFQRPPPIFSL